jgi:histidine triad (HIT) family protein
VSSSVVVPKTKRCAFCDYLAGRRPYAILRRLDLAAILVTREQRGRAHVLVVPTEHRETILDLKPIEATAVMASVIDAARAIDKAERAAGISVWQNNGINANQTIPHVHFHVAGTLDGGGTEWGPVTEVSVSEAEAIAEKLRKHLQNSLAIH